MQISPIRLTQGFTSHPCTQRNLALNLHKMRDRGCLSPCLNHMPLSTKCSKSAQDRGDELGKFHGAAFPARTQASFAGLWSSESVGLTGCGTFPPYLVHDERDISSAQFKGEHITDEGIGLHKSGEIASQYKGECFTR